MYTTHLQKMVNAQESPSLLLILSFCETNVGKAYFLKRIYFNLWRTVHNHLLDHLSEPL
jgi:hypothetical protein